MSDEVAELERLASMPLWPSANVADIVAMLPGFAFKSENFVTDADDGLPLIRIRDLGETVTAARYVGDYYEAFAVRDGDILVGMDGEFSAVRWQGGKALLNQRVLKLSSAAPDVLDEGFLYYRVQPALRELEQSISGTTVKHLSTKDLKRLVWGLPPLGEQRRIAEVLRSVDEAIAATQRTVDAASTVRQVALDAMIQRVLDDPGSEVRPLSDVAEVRTGLAKNKNRAGPKVLVPYLRVANVQDGWFDLADMQEIVVDPGQVDRYLLQAGDVLLTEGGDYDKLGRGGVWHGEISPCLHQNHVFCVRPDTAALLPDYFALATQSAWGRSYFLTCAKRTTNLASINSSQLRAFPVPAVPTATQAGLIEEMAGIDAMIDLEERQLETLLRLRAEVSSDLLTGQLRVPE